MNTRAATQCQGKVAFDDWATAERAAKRKRASIECNVHPYRCQLCHKVHLGSLPKGPTMRARLKMRRNAADGD